MSLEFKEKLEGQQPVSLWARDRDGMESGWQPMGKWKVPASPALEVNPKEGSGTARYFNLQSLSTLDPRGTAGISFVINDRLGWEGGCGMWVDFERNRGALADGKGGFLPEVYSYSLAGQKSEKCEVSSASAYQNSDYGAYLNSVLRFNANFAGRKKVWANARDKKGRESGWQELGVFDVLSANRAPAIELVSSAIGADGVTRLRVRWSDPEGLEDLQAVRVRVGAPGLSHNSCLITAGGTGSYAYLHDDRGYQTMYFYYGNNQQVQNSQCMVDAMLSGVSRSGDWLEAAFAVTFKAEYAGVKGIFLTALDYAGAGANEKLAGQITVPVAAGNTPPWLASVIHESRGLSGTILAEWEDQQGGQNLSELRLRLSAPGSESEKCELRYRRLEDDLSLLDDAGQEWLALGRPGQGGKVQENARCSVDPRQSSVKVDGRRIRWSAAFSVKRSAAGWQVVSTYGKDAGGAETGWKESGAWEALDVPEIVQVMPSTGSGPAKTYFVYARTGLGNEDMSKVRLLVNSTADAGSGCLLEGDYTTRRLRLAADDGTGWIDLDTRLPVQAENSRCQIQYGGFTTTANQVVLVGRLVFKEGFNGPKILFGQAENKQGYASAWENKGTWTVAAPNYGPEQEVFEVEGERGVRTRVKMQINDWNGLTDLTAVQLRIGNSGSMVGSCHFYIFPLSGIGLVNNAGSTYSVMQPGSNAIAENSQCRVAMADVRWAKSDTRLVLEMPVEFLPAYAGTQDILLTLQDEAYSGFTLRKMGEWVVE